MNEDFEFSLGELALAMCASETPVETAELVAKFAVNTFATDHCSVTLLRDKGRTLVTAASTDNVAERADRCQYELGDGPCVHAAVQSQSVVCNDIGHDARWPGWGVRVAAMGLTSVLSSAMQVGGRRVGSVNVYSEAGREFSAEDVQTGQLMALHAGAALRVSEQTEGLAAALESRTLIGQAQGILMERYGVSSDQAFATLRRYSQDYNVRLVEVAHILVRDGELIDGSDERPRRDLTGGAAYLEEDLTGLRGTDGTTAGGTGRK